MFNCHNFDQFDPLESRGSTDISRDVSREEADESAKSFARTSNNFGPKPLKATRSNGAVFRSLVQTIFNNPAPDIPDDEDWAATSNLVVEERASAVGARNELLPYAPASRPIKARRVGKRAFRAVNTSSLRRSLGLAGDAERDETFDADWATIQDAPALSGSELPRSRGRWPGEVVREMQAEDPEVMEAPPPEPDPYFDKPVDEDLSFGGEQTDFLVIICVDLNLPIIGYAQW